MRGQVEVENGGTGSADEERDDEICTMSLSTAALPRRTFSRNSNGLFFIRFYGNGSVVHWDVGQGRS